MSLVLPNDDRAPFFRGQTWKRVRNVSGVQIPPHSVVLVTGAESSADELVLTVTMPNSGSATAFYFTGYMVTGPQLIHSTSTSYGLATDLLEPGYVRYNTSNTPAFGQVWGAKNGQFTLEKSYWGFAILGGNTTSAGNAVTVARWMGIPTVLGKIDDTNVSLGGTCTVSVYNGATGTNDTGMEITGVLNRGKALTSVAGFYCAVSHNADVPILMWVSCT